MNWSRTDNKETLADGKLFAFDEAQENVQRSLERGQPKLIGFEREC